MSEDSLLGDPSDPPTGHLYAYGSGEPIARFDPRGTFWYRVGAYETLKSIATKFWRNPNRWPTIYNANRNRMRNPSDIAANRCLWVRKVVDASGNRLGNQCPIAGRIGTSRLPDP